MKQFTTHHSQNDEGMVSTNPKAKISFLQRLSGVSSYK